MKSTNYYNHFVSVAPDCVAKVGTIPPHKTPATIAQLEYEMISEHPYKFTSDEILYEIYCVRNGKTPIQEFFSKGKAYLRCSALPQRYGWGIHFDTEGKLAIYGVETKEYSQKITDRALEQRPAFAHKK